MRSKKSSNTGSRGCRPLFYTHRPTSPQVLVNRHPASPLCPLPRRAPAPALDPVIYDTVIRRGRALRPHSTGGTPTYIHACPAPASASAAAHPDKLTYMLALPPRRIRCCTPRYTYVHACPIPAPALRWRQTQIHIQIYRLSILIYIALAHKASACFTPTHTYVRCIHALQSGVAVGTPSSPAGSLCAVAAQICAVGGTNPSTTNAANTASP